MDIIAFFVQVAVFNAEGVSAFPKTAVLMMAFAFLGFDLYYIAWIFASKMKFPADMTSFVFSSLIGRFATSIEHMGKKLGEYGIKSQPTNAPIAPVAPKGK